MTVIASGNGFQVHSNQGRTIVEGSAPNGQQGAGNSFSFSITYSSEIYSYDTVWVAIDPQSSTNHDDFWTFDTPLISGTSTDGIMTFIDTRDPNSIFGTRSITINADHAFEDDEVFLISIYDSPVGNNLLFQTSFTIIDDDKMLGTQGADILSGTIWADWIEGFGGDDIVTGSAGNDTLNGGAGNDTLDGGAGDDRIDGGTGDDRMAGGAGNDAYYVDSINDKVAELHWPGEDLGMDHVFTSVSYSLSDNVEELTLIGSEAINGTGNELPNFLIGNNANNILNGGGGVDNLLGGAGNDIYVIDNADDWIVEYSGRGTDLVRASVTFSLVNYVENLSLTGSKAINATGNTISNILTGNSASNKIMAGSGHDTLLGRSGNDKLFGQSGKDALNGGAGNDLLDGGTGADNLIGSTGNDTYVVDNTADRVVERAGQGTDVVRSSISYVLGGNVERLTLTGAKEIDGRGNGLANILSGNGANNTLKGAGGNDTLKAGSGHDRLLGGSGNDILSGGAGADHFIFGRADGHDRIVDFRPGQDVIEISSGATVFSQLDIHRSGKATVIEFANVEITLLHTRPGQLDMDDFMFV